MSTVIPAPSSALPPTNIPIVISPTSAALFTDVCLLSMSTLLNNVLNLVTNISSSATNTSHCCQYFQLCRNPHLQPHLPPVVSRPSHLHLRFGHLHHLPYKQLFNTNVKIESETKLRQPEWVVTLTQINEEEKTSLKLNYLLRSSSYEKSKETLTAYKRFNSDDASLL